MNIDKSDLLNSILESLSQIDYIKLGEIPNIDLYMDQVTTFMDARLNATKRYENDKVLTKTMINNYAKNNLLPPPNKKKYSKDHILILLFIYYFKNILTIKDIQMMLKPITEKYFASGSDIDISAIYEEICNNETIQMESCKKSVKAAFGKSQETFKNAPLEDQEHLQLFAFIYSLSFDVYMKKLLIEKLIDQLPNPQEEKNSKEKK